MNSMYTFLLMCIMIPGLFATDDDLILPKRAFQGPIPGFNLNDHKMAASRMAASIAKNTLLKSADILRAVDWKTQWKTLWAPIFSGCAIGEIVGCARPRVHHKLHPHLFMGYAVQPEDYLLPSKIKPLPTKEMDIIDLFKFITPDEMMDIILPKYPKLSRIQFDCISRIFQNNPEVVVESFSKLLPINRKHGYLKIKHARDRIKKEKETEEWEINSMAYTDFLMLLKNSMIQEN